MPDHAYPHCPDQCQILEHNAARLLLEQEQPASTVVHNLTAGSESYTCTVETLKCGCKVMSFDNGVEDYRDLCQDHFDRQWDERYEYGN